MGIEGFFNSIKKYSLITKLDKNNKLKKTKYLFLDFNSIIHNISQEYHRDVTQKFIDNTQRLINNFNLWHGFSVGMGDIDISKPLEKHLFNFRSSGEVAAKQILGILDGLEASLKKP